MKTYFFLFFVFTCNLCFCQSYAVNQIPDSLLKNADAVLRHNETMVTIKSPSKAIINTKYVYTILNEAGAHHAEFVSYYSKIRNIKKLEGYLVDAFGKEIKNTKKKDFLDFSANDDISLITDSRYKKHNFYYATYPYTIAYEEELEYEGLFFLPNWLPVQPNCSVQYSKFTVQAPADYLVRYKQIAYNAEPIITTVSNIKMYSWLLQNFTAKLYEAYQPSWQVLYPGVLLAPSTFEIEGYKGAMDTWLKLGQFINTLNINKQQLPDAVKVEVHRLTDNIADTKEKVKTLYNYLQKNTRYISIQLGIGSWQPFDANYVATKKYGDCKALSNYMVSLLQEANIKANYVLIKAGENVNGLWEDFASNNFNHAIACVPMQKDTMWLECTSQTVSAGYMGTFTGGRKALLITEQGGVVVNTPNYTSAQNTQIRKVQAIINQEGDLQAKVKTKYSGIQQENLHGLIHGTTAAEKQKYLNSILNIPTYNVVQFDYIEIKNTIPQIEETLEINAPFYASITGKRLFLTPNIFINNSYRLKGQTNRQTDLVFRTAYLDIDSIQIKIPENYTVESMPKNVALNTAFGNFLITFAIKNNIIEVVRKSERQQHSFAKTEFDKISNYFEDIHQADRSRIVLVKKE